jgi:Sulfotransferase family
MPDDMNQWVPERVRWGGTGPLVEWIYGGGRRFTEPFFEDTVHRLRCASPADIRRQTGMEELETWAGGHPGLRPAGFIFHLSRCGSTLISQMLAALPRNRVMSEAPALDDVLRLAFRRPELDTEQLVVWLRAMMSVLGQPAVETERHYFVKWDCWHTHQLSLIRRAFPETPWIFLYRNPVEVLASQMRAPGAWTVPGALEAELIGGADAQGSREEYCAQMLAGICRAAMSQSATLMNYTELPEVVCDRLAAFFGVEYSAAEQRQMLDAAQFDAKSPQFTFASDSEAKRRAASPRVLEAAERWVAGIYRELERLRKSGQGLPGCAGIDYP